LFFSFALLGWLLIESVFQLDIAATIDKGLTSMKKQEVEEMQNIDSVKSYNTQCNKANYKKDSRMATKRIWLILIICGIQLFIWINKDRISSSKIFPSAPGLQSKPQRP
jgi:hypothetical protein